MDEVLCSSGRINYEFWLTLRSFEEETVISQIEIIYQHGSMRMKLQTFQIWKSEIFFPPQIL